MAWGYPQTQGNLGSQTAYPPNILGTPGPSISSIRDRRLRWVSVPPYATGCIVPLPILTWILWRWQAVPVSLAAKTGGDVPTRLPPREVAELLRFFGGFIREIVFLFFGREKWRIPGGGGKIEVIFCWSIGCINVGWHFLNWMECHYSMKEITDHKISGLFRWMKSAQTIYPPEN